MRNQRDDVRDEGSFKLRLGFTRFTGKTEIVCIHNSIDMHNSLDNSSYVCHMDVTHVTTHAFTYVYMCKYKQTFRHMI